MAINPISPQDPIEAPIIFRARISLKRAALWYCVGAAVALSLLIALYWCGVYELLRLKTALILIAFFFAPLAMIYQALFQHTKFRSIIFDRNGISFFSLYLKRHTRVDRNEIESLRKHALLTALLFSKRSNGKWFHFHWSPYACAQLPGRKLADFAEEWFNQTA